MESLLKILQSKYSHGESLFDIFEEIKAAYGTAEAQVIFHSFVKKNKNDKNFMREFNSTAFNLVIPV